ncbi:endolysin [Bacillus phage BCASJ1c]|uniref:Lysin n=1 Tax=Bacillus phage BCASJ1c TaxID=294382 RepID=Q5YA51_9CAUD|nr:endolysin [Bacillus phage BCASJ1c]AAU85106.1 lysin [Bacillus phage BCASJ1c]
MSVPFNVLNRPVKVFIDAGHGGSDPGAVANGLREKDLCLQVALAVKTILENEYENVEVRLSRETDVFLTLGERCRLANNWGADIFISIHFNAFTPAATGFETFRYRNAPNRTRDAHVEIHRVMFAQAFRGKMPDRGSKTAGFYVVKNTNMTAVLTEGGFLTNSNDARHLKSGAFLREVAEAHAAGIASIFTSVKKRQAKSNKPSPSITEWTGQVLRHGERGPLVRSLQEQLIDKGFDLGRYGADGVFGDITRNAVRDFQRAAGIAVDGVPGPQTFRALKAYQPDKGQMVIVDVDRLNVRSRPSFADSAVSSQVRRGEAFTIVERVNVANSNTDMYKLKSGLYITASENFVRTRSA